MQYQYFKLDNIAFFKLNIFMLENSKKYSEFSVSFIVGKKSHNMF